MPHFLPVVCWCGRQELQIYVDVADAVTMKGIPGTPVAILSGPQTPFDGMRAAPDPNSKLADVQRITTDENGHAQCSRRFFAAGKDGWFVHRGYVRLTGTWIHVAPSGYGEVLLPLDGQRFRPRGLDEDSPVYVTILLKRIADSSGSAGQQEHTR